ncbi:hypothetical protein BKA83DRAFT_4129458 [Pisolithus microcarpus]|nr:hypothetical protein BKA83DRAFT_4129458 [Pisolithus microcarpus]
MGPQISCWPDFLAPSSFLCFRIRTRWQCHCQGLFFVPDRVGQDLLLLVTILSHLLPQNHQTKDQILDNFSLLSIENSDKKGKDAAKSLLSPDHDVSDEVHLLTYCSRHRILMLKTRQSLRFVPLYWPVKREAPCPDASLSLCEAASVCPLFPTKRSSTSTDISHFSLTVHTWQWYIMQCDLHLLEETMEVGLTNVIYWDQQEQSETAQVKLTCTAAGHSATPDNMKSSAETWQQTHRCQERKSNLYIHRLHVAKLYSQQHPTAAHAVEELGMPVKVQQDMQLLVKTSNQARCLAPPSVGILQIEHSSCCEKNFYTQKFLVSLTQEAFDELQLNEQIPPVGIPDSLREFIVSLYFTLSPS